VSDKESTRFDRTQTLDKQFFIPKSMIPAGSLKEITKSIKSLQINRLAGFFVARIIPIIFNFPQILIGWGNNLSFYP